LVGGGGGGQAAHLRSTILGWAGGRKLWTWQPRRMMMMVMMIWVEDGDSRVK
jgi:hypothetical protein